jgi:hypothetical protein
MTRAADARSITDGLHDIVRSCRSVYQRPARRIWHS